ncbi:MAG: hypothetical protein KJ957_03060 [Candidatus Omnitrophica bacterium]|nr:hypothetical protein [Candidatus Omnitrophota bacterium]
MILKYLYKVLVLNFEYCIDGEVINMADTKLNEVQTRFIQAEKLEAISMIATGVAHEVKNPLGVILQGVDYLEGKIPKGQKDISEVFSMIKNNIQRIDGIVCSLRDFSKTELKIIPQDINSILESSFTYLREHSIGLENIEVIVELESSLPKVLVDKEGIGQVFRSLLLNAVQSMPKGGNLFIRSYLRHLDKIGFRVGRRKLHGDYFELGEKAVVAEIEDTGSGISEANLRRIFDPFFTTKGPRDGIGLGLSMARNIIDLHRGFIEIKSREDKGTRISIILKIEGGQP